MTVSREQALKIAVEYARKDPELLDEVVSETASVLHHVFEFNTADHEHTMPGCVLLRVNRLTGGISFEPTE